MAAVVPSPDANLIQKISHPFWCQLDAQDTLPRSSGIAQSFGLSFCKGLGVAEARPQLEPERSRRRQTGNERKDIMAKKRSAPAAALHYTTEEGGKPVCYVGFDGKRIAKC